MLPFASCRAGRDKPSPLFSHGFQFLFSHELPRERLQGGRVPGSGPSHLQAASSVGRRSAVDSDPKVPVDCPDTIVHAYVNLDHQAIYKMVVCPLDDLDEFGRRVLNYLEREEESLE